MIFPKITSSSCQGLRCARLSRVKIQPQCRLDSQPAAELRVVCPVDGTWKLCPSQNAIVKKCVWAVDPLICQHPPTISLRLLIWQCHLSQRRWTGIQCPSRTSIHPGKCHRERSIHSTHWTFKLPCVLTPTLSHHH
jgi:hypothetical protein